MNIKTEIKRIPLLEPCLGEKELNSLRECIETGWVSSGGRLVETLEEKIATFVGVKYAVATVNGTSALHMALKVIGVLPNEEVFVPALTFIAPVNAVSYLGAHPVVIDVEEETGNIDPGEIRQFILDHCELRGSFLLNRRTNRRIRAILSVDSYGHPAEYDKIWSLAKEYHLTVVEDACESLGASYHHKKAGSLGDIACLSFNGNKIITTGGGGMILTNCLEWAEKARYLTTQAKDDPFEYIHHEVGYNYRMPNLNAALGLGQLEQINQFLFQKREIAKRYQEAFEHCEALDFSREREGCHSSFWLFNIFARREKIKQKIIYRLRKREIEVRPLWQPIPWQRPYQDTNGSVPIAEKLYRRGLSLPTSVGLARQEQDSVIEEVLKAIEERPIGFVES